MAADLISALMCPWWTLLGFNHHNSPNSLQGFFSKSLAACSLPGPVSPPAMQHNLPNDHRVLFPRMEQVLLCRGAQSQNQAWYSDICSYMQCSAPAVSANNCVIWKTEHFTCIQDQIFIRTAHKQLQDPLGRKAVIGKYGIFTALQLLNQRASIYAHLLRFI